VAAVDIVPVPGESFERTLTAGAPDVVREMFRAFAQQMMDAEVETLCGAGYGEVSRDRVNSRKRIYGPIPPSYLLLVAACLPRPRTDLSPSNGP
jgi:hypothetical protein